MVRVTFTALTPSTVPADGWVVRYRIKGSLGVYTTLTGFTSIPFHFDTTDAQGTLYEGFIRRDCGTLESAEFAWATVCACNTGGGYVPSPDGTYCVKAESIGATVTRSNYCLAPAVNGAYGNFESRVYNFGFTQATLNLAAGTADPLIFGRSISAPQWANPTANTTASPLNREGVWADSDCDGNKDSTLTSGEKTTVGCIYNNIGATKTMYLGAGADNQFQIIQNGVLVADSGIVGANQFKIWHIIPLTIIPGLNYINITGTADGSVDNSIGMVLYDNTATQILAATSDAALNIAFKSSSLRGTHYDVATCPATYSLDMTGGVGAYTCKRTLIAICNA